MRVQSDPPQPDQAQHDCFILLARRMHPSGSGGWHAVSRRQKQETNMAMLSSRITVAVVLLYHDKVLQPK